MAQKGKMLEAIQKEIRLAKAFEGVDEQIETLYFGGGTPSLLSGDEIGSILEAVNRKFEVQQHAEISLEANPDDINSTVLNEWLGLGINRLSLGVQSFSEQELNWMNRAHHAADSLRSIDEITAAGFTNFSVDLIYGSPLLTDVDLKKTLEIIIEKKVPHISAYALTVEPKTALDKMISKQTSRPVDPQRQANQFVLLMDIMAHHGYEHYEISNFARPGMRSRHNSSYWQGKSYYGFGPSAHSYNGINKRQWNIANNSLYIQSLQKEAVPFEEELLTKSQQLNEFIMISLRTSAGLNLEEVASLFGNMERERISKQASKFIESGKLAIDTGNLVLTREGKLFADGIAADLFA